MTWKDHASDEDAAKLSAADKEFSEASRVFEIARFKRNSIYQLIKKRIEARIRRKKERDNRAKAQSTEK